MLSLIATALLVLATTGAALAKCPAGSTEEQCQGMAAEIDMPGSFQAGTETSVSVWLIYDGRPVTDTNSVDLVFARVSDGTVLRFPADSTAESDGRYTAQVVLPAGGTWTIAADVSTADGSYSVPLQAAQVAAPVGGPGVPPVSSPAPVTFPIWMGAGLVIAMLGGAIALAAQARRRPATA